MEVDYCERAEPLAVSLTVAPAMAAATPSPVRHPARVLAAGLAIGALSDLLVYGQHIGVGFTLAAVAFVVALFIIYRGERKAGGTGTMHLSNVVPLTLGLLFFAVMASVRGGLILQVMNIAACVRLGCLLVNRFPSKTNADLTIMELLFGPFQTLIVSLIQVPPVFAAIQADMPDQKRRSGIAKTVLRGILISAMPLTVFIGLLSSADPLFAHGVNAVVAWLFPADFAIRLWRIVVASTVAVLATGALTAAVRRQTPAASTVATKGGDASPSAPRGLIGFAESMMVLLSVGAVFAAFVAVQFVALFGGARHVLAVPGLTYAEYARSGFNELVWVAVLALTLISALRSATRLPEKGTALTSFRGAASVLIGLTLIVLFSAVQRMNAYEAAYGATATRLSVDTFIAFLALALLWRAATLFVGPARPTFAAGLLVCAVGFCATVDLQSPEAAAVRANTARYQATGKIDADYLLGTAADDDAVPALCDALRATATGTPLHHRLRERLLDTRKATEQAAEEDAWSAANLSRQTARKALAEVTTTP